MPLELPSCALRKRREASEGEAQVECVCSSEKFQFEQGANPVNDVLGSGSR